MKISKLSFPALGLIFGCATVLTLGACGRGGHDDAHKGDDDHHEHAHEADDDDHHEHSHEARHGGVPVVLGDEAYHVEFADGEAPGTLRAYFLDGHMENYVRLAAPSFAATATIDGLPRPLVFVAVADAATGETVGDSALFVASAEWLKDRPAMSLHVPRLEVRGMEFADVAVSLPAPAHP